QRVSPRAALMLGAWQGATLKAIYSEAFRAPSWLESAAADYLSLPSHDLKPETVRSAEVVIDQSLGSQNLIFGAFRSWWKGLVGTCITQGGCAKVCFTDGVDSGLFRPDAN